MLKINDSFRKNPWKFAALAFICLIVLYLLLKCFPLFVTVVESEKVSNKYNIACSVNSDCVLMKLGCSTCLNETIGKAAPEWIAVNRKESKKYEEEKKQEFGGCEPILCGTPVEMAKNQIASNERLYSARCIAHQCVKVKKWFPFPL